MFNLIRLFWNLIAIGGAVAVGVLTHDAGLTALTFIGGLIVPRLLGLMPRRGWAFARGVGRGPWPGWHAAAHGRRDRLEEWHRRAHGEAAPQPTGRSTI